MSPIQTPKETKSLLNDLKPGTFKRKKKKVRVNWELWNNNRGYAKHSILLKYYCMETNALEQPGASSSGSV